MRQLSRSTGLLLGLILGAGPALAQTGPALNRGVDRATTIVIGRLDQYIAEPESIDRFVQQKMRTSSGMAGGNVEMMVMSTINPRGTYSFTVLDTLIGTNPSRLLIRLPRVTSMSLFGGSVDGIPLKGTYLLILEGSERSGYAPAFTAPIRISPGVRFPVAGDRTRSDAFSGVVKVLIDSLADPETRKSAAYYLREARSGDAINALRPYIDDPDDGLRSSALECLATNQDISIIPRLLGWRYNSPNVSGNPMSIAIRKYTTPEVVPVFLDILVDPQYSQSHSQIAMALRQLPQDKRAIPYWVKSLRNPNTQVQYHAYYCIHTLVPDLGPPLPFIQFGQDREPNIREIEQWWAKQQSPAGPAPATTPAGGP